MLKHKLSQTYKLQCPQNKMSHIYTAFQKSFPDVLCMQKNYLNLQEWKEQGRVQLPLRRKFFTPLILLQQNITSCTSCWRSRTKITNFIIVNCPQNFEIFLKSSALAWWHFCWNNVPFLEVVGTEDTPMPLSHAFKLG